MTDNNPSSQLPPMTRTMQWFSIAMFFLLGATLAAFLFGDPLDLFGDPASGPVRGPETMADPAASSQTLYMCPMHPEVIESDPEAVCPICKMDLVEVRETGQATPAGGDDGSGAILIDPVQVQNIGVVSTPAVLEDIARTSKTVGILDYDANRVGWVNTKYGGWIEKVHVSYVGQTVRGGDALFEIYSPDLVTTQEEYLGALDYLDSLQGSRREQTVQQAEALVRSARERLLFWDVSEEQLQRLTDTRSVRRSLTVHSPVDGVVVGIMQDSLEGMYVKPGMDLYKIADLSSIWVHAEVYESDLPWIREGLPAVVTFRNDPDQVYRGKVLYLYPEVDRQTRTLKVCIAVTNPQVRMRPGMYADVALEGPKVRNALVIPRSAVLRSGERDLVFIDQGEGRFLPREVRLGMAGEGDRIRILEGLEPGMKVVVQAQFMLDSESRIQEAISKFRTRSTTAGHSH